MINEDTTKLYVVIAWNKSHSFFRMVYITKKQVEKMFPKDIRPWISFNDYIFIPRDLKNPNEGNRKRKYFLSKQTIDGVQRMVIQINLHKFASLFKNSEYEVYTRPTETIESFTTTIDEPTEEVVTTETESVITESNRYNNSTDNYFQTSTGGYFQHLCYSTSIEDYHLNSTGFQYDYTVHNENDQTSKPSFNELTLSYTYNMNVLNRKFETLEITNPKSDNKKKDENSPLLPINLNTYSIIYRGGRRVYHRH